MIATAASEMAAVECPLGRVTLRLGSVGTEVSRSFLSTWVVWLAPTTSSGNASATRQ